MESCWARRCFDERHPMNSLLDIHNFADHENEIIHKFACSMNARVELNFHFCLRGCAGIRRGFMWAFKDLHIVARYCNDSRWIQSPSMVIVVHLDYAQIIRERRFAWLLHLRVEENWKINPQEQQSILIACLEFQSIFNVKAPEKSMNTTVAPSLTWRSCAVFIVETEAMRESSHRHEKKNVKYMHRNAVFTQDWCASTQILSSIALGLFTILIAANYHIIVQRRPSGRWIERNTGDEMTFRSESAVGALMRCPCYNDDAKLHRFKLTSLSLSISFSVAASMHQHTQHICTCNKFSPLPSAKDALLFSFLDHHGSVPFNLTQSSRAENSSLW